MKAKATHRLAKGSNNTIRRTQAWKKSPLWQRRGPATSAALARWRAANPEEAALVDARRAQEVARGN